MGCEVYSDDMGLKGAEADSRVMGTLGRLNLHPQLKLSVLSGGEGCGMRGVAVKCIDITQNSDCEGSIPAPD